MERLKRVSVQNNNIQLNVMNDGEVPTLEEGETSSIEFCRLLTDLEEIGEAA